MSDIESRLKRYLWVANRVNTDKHPITDEQLYRFGRHPHGSLPPRCVEAKRLPDSYGMTTGERSCIHKEKLTVTPDGRLCLVTNINGMHAVVCGETVYELLHDQEENPWINCKVKLLGFSKLGLPVTSLERLSSEASFEQYKIFFGSEKRFENESGFGGATLLENDDLIYWTRDTNGKESLFRNEQFVIEIKGRVMWAENFFQLPSGKFAYFAQTHPGVPHNKIQYLDQDMPEMAWGEFVEIRSTETGLIAIRDNCWIEVMDEEQSGFNDVNGFCSKLKAKERFSNSPTQKLFGKNPYRGNYTELDDGCIVYTGKTTRDDLRCMVVNGEEQESFEQVSPLFLRGDIWMYYGLIGRHVYTMEIPDTTKK